MSAVFPNSFSNNIFNNASRLTGLNNGPNQLVNVSMQVAKPCPVVPPMVVSYFYASSIGWNAVLVGLLSSLLAIAFLLTCLYYLAFRRRFVKETSDGISPVPLLDKVAASKIPVTTASQSVSTTVLTEQGKETKISTYSEQASGPVVGGDFTIAMPAVGNGHAAPALTNGLSSNGTTDPSELRLLQHEHH